MKIASLSKSNRSRQAYRDGIRREAWAALWLRMKFYRILGQRLRTPFGEVDVLAFKNGTLVIIEVKSRNSAEAAAEAIHPAQRQRLMRAGEYLAAKFCAIPPATIRMDAMLFAPRRFPQHIKNAFGNI